MSAHAQLRALTAKDHEWVDGAFGRFDLSDRSGYIAFLTAHARALPAVESALAGKVDPPLRPRADLLRRDLAELGVTMPEPLPFALPDDAASAFGAAYVIEGSRLGGGMLARTVPDGLPLAYLSATHLPGEWRAFGQALDAAAQTGGPEWIDRCATTARRVFALYATAAR